MATPNTIAIDITAVNTASPELAKLQKDVANTAKAVQESSKVISGAGAEGMKDLTKHTELTGKSLREVLGPLRLFSENIAQQVSPALGGMVTGLGAATREGARFSLALSAGIIATTAVATGIALYIERLNALTKAQAEANFAARGFDMAGLRAQLDASAKAVEEFNLSWQNKFLSNFGKTGPPRWLEWMLGKPDPAIRAAQEAAFLPGLPLERQIQAAKQIMEFNQAWAQSGAGMAGRGAAMGDLEAFIAGQIRLNTAINQEADALERVIRFEAQADRMRAERRGQLAAESPGISIVEQGRLEVARVMRDTRLQALNETTRLTELQISARQGRPDTYTGSEEEAAIRGGVEFATQSGERLAANIARQTAAEAQARTQLLGLTREQRLELTLTAIQQERVLAYAQAAGKLDGDHLRAMADINAEVKTTVERQKELAQSNPFVGLTLGLQEVVDEFTSAGEVMRQGIHQVGSDMARTFSQTFTQVVTGDFKKLADLPKAFALNMINAIGDVLSKAAIGNLFSTFSRGLSGGGLLSIADLGALAGGSAGGAASLVAMGGQVYQSVSVAGGGSVLVPVAMGTTPGAGGTSLSSIASLAPGGNYSSAFGNLGGMFGNLGAWWNTPIGLSGGAGGNAVFSGGQFITNAGELAMQGIPVSGLAGQSPGFFASLTPAQYFGAAAGAVGLGFTIYGGLQGAPTAMNIATGAVSGAISGALIGSIVPGIGTAVGAIAGGLLGGGAAAFGKGDDGTAKARKQAEITRVSEAASSLVAAVNGTQTLDDLYTLLISWGSGTTGGTSSVAVVSFVTVGGTSLVIGRPNGTYATATKAQFVEGTLAGTYRASIQQGIAQHYKDDANMAIEQAVTNKVRELSALESGVLIGYNEAFQTGAGGAGGTATRTTLLSASNVDQVPAGTDLFVLQNTLDSMTADQAQQLLEQLVKVDKDRDLQLLRVESDFGATVTIGTLTA